MASVVVAEVAAEVVAALASEVAAAMAAELLSWLAAPASGGGEAASVARRGAGAESLSARPALCTRPALVACAGGTPSAVRSRSTCAGMLVPAGGCRSSISLALRICAYSGRSVPMPSWFLTLSSF